MIRSLIKVPILAVSLELYDDSTCTMRSKVEKRQWFDGATSLGKLVRGGRVLVVDEVDDTRTTLQYCLEELMETNAPAAVAVAVVHNKLKKKTGRLPAHVQYFAGARRGGGPVPGQGKTSVAYTPPPSTIVISSFCLSGTATPGNQYCCHSSTRPLRMHAQEATAHQAHSGPASKAMLNFSLS
jgi:hypothetical protein